MIKTLLPALILALLTNACATSMSEEDYNSIHSIQVLTDFEDTFYINDFGLTAFNNKAYDGKIEDWQLKSQLIDTLKSSLPSSMKVVDVKSLEKDQKIVTEWARNLTPEIRSQAESAKADSIIILTKNGIWNSGSGGFWELTPARGGFAFHSKSLLGKPVLTCVTFSYSLLLYRLSDSEKILNIQDVDCENQNTVEATKEFDKYTAEERGFFKTSLEKSIHGRFAEKVQKSFVVDKPKAPVPRDKDEDLRMR